MNMYLNQFTNVKKCFTVLIIASTLLSIHAGTDRMKLLIDADMSSNQASGTYYWAEEISSSSYYKYVGTINHFGNISGLTQGSEFEVKLTAAGTAGATTGVVLIPYDKNGSKLTTITGVLWNEQLSADYSTIKAKFSIPLQVNYAIKDIDSLKVYAYNINYLSGTKVWIKNFKLYVDKSTLLKNLYFEEYDSTDSGIILKDGEWCKQFDTGYYTFIKQVNINGACNLGAGTIFEFQIKACGTSDALLGAYAIVYNSTGTKIGTTKLMWNIPLNEKLQYYSAKFTFDTFNVEDVAYIKLYAYRCNQQGTIWFNTPALYIDLNQKIFNKEYVDGDLNAELHNSQWALKINSGYYYLCQQINFPGNHDVFESSSFEIDILAAGDSLLGAKIQLFDDSDNLLESISTNLWNSVLTPAYQWHSAIFTLPENYSYNIDDIKKMKIYLYRCNQQDTVWVNSVVLKCLNYEISYNEIENNLALDGFLLSEANNMLIAHKADQRNYYQILSDVNELKKYKYLGTTYLKSSAVGNYFPIGVYIYKTEEYITQLATAWGVDSDMVFSIIAQDVADHNCNTIYFSRLSPDPIIFNLAVQKFQEKGISVFGQFNEDCYLRTENGRSYYESVTAPAAELLLPNYHNTSGIVGWMGGEEAKSEKIHLVQDYRALCQQVDPYHGTYTLHNNLASQEIDTLNLPDWFGFDRYEFRELINPSFGMKIGTPLFSINTVNKDINNNYWAAAKIGRPLIFVGQGYGVQHEFNASILQSEYGINTNQMTAKSGFVENMPGIWKGWLKYLPPENCMYLQTWTAIAAGAKGILLFHYFDSSGSYSVPGTTKYKALVDDYLTESSQWLEFKNSISSIQPLIPLFSQWHKEWNAKATVDDNNKKWIIVSSFIRTFDEERYLMVVNKRIGEWDSISPELPDNNTQLYYDDSGLAGITTVGALSFELDIEGTQSIWDVLTGNQLIKNGNNKYELTLAPGRGMVLMQGTLAQLTAIRTELGL